MRLLFWTGEGNSEKAGAARCKGDTPADRPDRYPDTDGDGHRVRRGASPRLKGNDQGAPGKPGKPPGKANLPGWDTQNGEKEAL